MSRVFIRDIEEVREFVRMHQTNDYFDSIVKKLMKR